MRRAILTLLLVLSATAGVAHAQEIILRGSVSDTEGEPLSGAIVEVRHPDAERGEYYTAATADGRFELRLQARGPRLLLEVGYIGFKTLTREIEAKDQTISLLLEESPIELRGVTVKVPRVTVARDTITYQVSQIRGESDYVLEDVLRRLPGVSIDTEGMISYQGKPINKFYIEGLDMLGGRYSLASKNLRAEDISSVQVYENHQPLKVLQGVERSEAAALNIRLKQSAKRRPIGYGALGAGISYEPLYRGDLFGLIVGERSQHLLTLKGNNHGDSYRYETSSHISSVSAPAAPGRDLIAGDPMGDPSISDKRYMRNHSALLSYNGIAGIRPGVTLGVRGMADLHRIRYEQGYRSLFTTPEGMVTLRAGEQASRRADHGSIELHYEDNQSDHYLGNTLVADFDRTRSLFLIEGDNPVRQEIRDYAGTISNGLRYTRRTEERITTLSSVLSYGATPDLILSADTQGHPQLISARHFYTREEGSREWQVSSHSFVGAGARFTARILRLRTEYVSASELSGSDLCTELTPYYRYRRGQMEARLTVPLSWSRLAYRESVEEKSGRYDHLKPQVSASVSYRPSPGQNVSLGLSTREDYGSFESFITTPILREYRTTYIPGVGTPSVRRSLLLRGSGTYRQPFTDFFTSLTLALSRSETNRLTDSSITSHETTAVEVDRKAQSYNLSALHTISKGLPRINTLIKLQTSYIGVSGTILRSGQPLGMQSHALASTLTLINDLWQRRITGTMTLDYSTAFRRVDAIAREALPPRMEQLRVGYDLHVTPMESLSVSLACAYDYLHTIGGTGAGNFYLDARMSYRLHGWEAEMELANLTNRHYHLLSRSSGADSHTYYYRLRPFGVSLSLKHNF